MADLRSGRWLVAVLALGLLLAGCGPAASTNDDLYASPLDGSVSAPTSTLTPTSTSAPTATLTAVPTMTFTPGSTSAPVPSAMLLVVIHTNDNWGETEPCG